MTTATYEHFSGTGAENYERYFVPAIGTPVAAGTLDAADLQPGESVVDVACGTGIVARLAAAAVGPTGSVVGVDVAPDMIEVAGRTAALADSAPIEWHEADAASLPLPDGSHDVALCQMGLMFMPDKVAVLREMRRVLKPEGRIVVTTPGPIQAPFEAMEDALTHHIDPGLAGFVNVVFSMPDPDAVAGLLAEAGFSAAHAHMTTARFQLDGPAEFLWQYINLTPMGPIVAQASTEAKAALEAQVVETWQPYVVDGGTPLDQPMVIASGTV
ncbi:MAG: methyltransferase domain-containing protein [Acidimicrobiales bacterium]